MDKNFWTREKSVTLIELYEKHGVLWDPKDSMHRNKQGRQDAFEQITRELGLEMNEVEEVKKKMESLLSQYRRERKCFSLGFHSDEALKKPWWGLKYFKFLDDKYAARMTVSCLPIESFGYTAGSDEDFATNDGSEHYQMEQQPSFNNSIQYNNAVAGPSMSGTQPPAKRWKFSTAEDGCKLPPPPPTQAECYSQSDLRDEHTVYGETIANRLRKIRNQKSLCILRHQIENLIFAAEMEEFSQHEYECS